MAAVLYAMQSFHPDIPMEVALRRFDERDSTYYIMTNTNLIWSRNGMMAYRFKLETGRRYMAMIAVFDMYDVDNFMVYNECDVCMTPYSFTHIAA